MANSLRGTDASGIASICTAFNKIEHTKLPVPGFMFPSNRYAGTLISKANLAKTITICHTRSSTIGGDNQSNAHPFLITSRASERQIIGVHNGSLTGWTQKPNGKDYYVDSNWALAHIFNRGIEAFKDFEGSYCFVWWDTANPGMLNIALNKERPMNVAITGKKDMAFASEAGMLYWLMERNFMDVDGEIMKLSPNFWYSFPVDKPAEFSKVALPLAEKVVGVARTPPKQTGTFAEVDAFLKRVAGNGTNGSGASATITHKAIVTLDEIDMAKLMNLNGRSGVFNPIWEDEATGEILGDFDLEGDDTGQYTAIIRCHDNSPVWHKDTMWKCNVLGVQDNGEGKEIVLVCSRPTLSILPKKDTVN